MPLYLLYCNKQLPATIWASNAFTSTAASDCSACCRDSVAAVKRLLRELFTEQLNLRQRLDTLETTAAETLEAADDYELSLRGPENSRTTWSRSPVRISGSFAAAGVLPWSQVGGKAACRSWGHPGHHQSRNPH